MANDSAASTILLVDDEPRITDGLSRHFSSRHYRTLKATSAAEGYRILETQPVDVVVSDEQMPGQTGSQFLAGVRRQYPQTVRIILTGQASLETAIRAINDGEVYRFFLKPCNPVDLVVTIQQALAHKRLEERSRELLAEFRKQAAMLQQIEQHHPGLLELHLDDSGAILVDEADADIPVENLLRDIERSIESQRQRLPQ